MESGVISVSSLSGGFDLQATVESGQTYLWRREDGGMYDVDRAHGGSAWYCTVADGTPLRVRQVDGRLEWEAPGDVEPQVRRLLGLDDDLAAVRDRAPDDPVVEEAFEAFSGLRIVRDPSFATLITFICSAQMRVSRIHSMATAMAREFGDTYTFETTDGPRTYDAFPTPEQLATATEGDLRDLSLGHRAPYVERTAEMVANGEAHPEKAREMAYEDAREYLTRFVGVGEKVADCVLLFSLEQLGAVPLDTWIRTAIEKYYPDCAKDNYAKTSRAIRDRLGGDVAGYVQTYVFYHLRTR